MQNRFDIRNWLAEKSGQSKPPKDGYYFHAKNQEVTVRRIIYIDERMKPHYVISWDGGQWPHRLYSKEEIESALMALGVDL